MKNKKMQKCVNKTEQTNKTWYSFIATTFIYIRSSDSHRWHPHIARAVKCGVKPHVLQLEIVLDSRERSLDDQKILAYKSLIESTAHKTDALPISTQITSAIQANPGHDKSKFHPTAQPPLNNSFRAHHAMFLWVFRLPC